MKRPALAFLLLASLLAPLLSGCVMHLGPQAAASASACPPRNDAVAHNGAPVICLTAASSVSRR